MTWLIAIVIVVALGLAAAAAAGRMGTMSGEPVHDVYRQDLPTRPLNVADLDTIRFGITLRGYAMDQVDDVLDRVGYEVEERDRLIRELTGREPAEVLAERRATATVPSGDDVLPPQAAADADAETARPEPEVLGSARPSSDGD